MNYPFNFYINTYYFYSEVLECLGELSFFNTRCKSGHRLSVSVASQLSNSIAHWSSQKRARESERIKEWKPNTASYSEEEAEEMRNGRKDYMDREMENFYLYLKGTDMVGARWDSSSTVVHLSPCSSLSLRNKINISNLFNSRRLNAHTRTHTDTHSSPHLAAAE